VQCRVFIHAGLPSADGSFTHDKTSSNKAFARSKRAGSLQALETSANAMIRNVAEKIFR
jgi:hypothetical protein